MTLHTQTDTNTILTSSKQRVEAFLQHYLDKFNSQKTNLIPAIEYALFNGGKRLRPALVYAAGLAFNTPIEQLDAPAAAIECIHSYSLVHDDLPSMDDDDLRRGLPTCHRQFDESTAILVGDALQTLGFEILSDPKFSSTNTNTLIHILAKASGARGMVIGQQLDIEQTNNAAQTCTIEELILRHELKTGALFEASVLMGAHCGNANATQLAHLSAFSKKIGLAFQIYDDILPAISDTQTMGKSADSDLDNDKNTFLTLLGVEESQTFAKTCIAEGLDAIVAARLPNPEPLELLADKMIKRIS